jgi:hypothetical protein
MMDPEMYFREAERIEAEIRGQKHPLTPPGNRKPEIRSSAVYGFYSREQLASGCILYRLNKLMKGRGFVSGLRPHISQFACKESLK